MNALSNWLAGDEDGSQCCTLDKGVFDAAIGIQISKCKCPGGDDPAFCGGSTTIACVESCDQINDNVAATTRPCATKGGNTFQSSSSGSNSDDGSSDGAVVGVATATSPPRCNDLPVRQGSTGALKPLRRTSGLPSALERNPSLLTPLTSGQSAPRMCL